MPKPGKPVHVPLREDDAIRLAFRGQAHRFYAQARDARDWAKEETMEEKSNRALVS
jgi:hypothetical protein